MSEQCKYDEQVLDYLYGELAEAERAEFASHLAGCPSCTREIESLSGVRKKVTALPRPELSSDAAAKMTAQLMEAAIAATKAQKPSVGGGKIIPFPTGRLRRFMTHPATALVTVAAAALFLVVFKSKEPTVPVSDSPLPVGKIEAPAKLESPEKTAALAAPVGAPTSPPNTTAAVASGTEAKPQATVTPPPAAQPVDSTGGTRAVAALGKPMDVRGGVPQAGASDGKFLDSTTRARETATASSAPPPKKPMAWGPVPAETPPPVYAKADRAPEAKDEAENGRRFAQPPPPPAAVAEPAAPQVVAQAAPTPAPATKSAEEEGVQGGVVSQSKARQHQRTVDELERAELAQAPGGDSDGLSKRQVAASSYGKVQLKPSSASRDSLDDDLSGTNTAGPGGLADKATEKNSQSTPLAQVYEHIRAGRCSEAKELLQKLERSAPGTSGLSDASSAWQRDCGAKQIQQNNLQQNYLPQRPSEQQLQQNYQNLQQRNLQLPPAPSQAAAPMKMERSYEPMEARRTMAKKAAPLPAPVNKAPAKAKASKADAAATAY